MKALILLFLFLTVVASNSPVDLSQEVKPQGAPLTIVQLGPRGSGPRTSYAVVSGVLDRRRMVIRDRETWADVWKQIYGGPFSFSWTGPGSEKVPNLPPPAPQIDFSHHMLLIVTMGSKPPGAYEIVVEGVYEQANQLEVVVRNVSPGRSCFNQQYGSQPVDIVEIEKREGPVVFRDVDIVTDCSEMRRAP